MGNRVRSTLLILFALLATDAVARSAGEVRAFKRDNPCPATGMALGACPGWEVDHVVPLCGGGADKPENMQWLTIEAHKHKTGRDIRACRKYNAEIKAGA